MAPEAAEAACEVRGLSENAEPTGAECLPNPFPVFPLPTRLNLSELCFKLAQALLVGHALVHEPQGTQLRSRVVSETQRW